MLDLPTIHAPSSEAWNHPCRRQFYRAATEDVKRCEKPQPRRVTIIEFKLKFFLR
jgi:hypothetical protein